MLGYPLFNDVKGKITHQTPVKNIKKTLFKTRKVGFKTIVIKGREQIKL